MRFFCYKDVAFERMQKWYLCRQIQNANLNIGYNQERIFILKYCLLEKAVYEIGYELNSRPRWALIPLKGISNIINH